MATMKKAMKKAGVRGAPLNQRVWEWLYDNQHHTAPEIGIAIGASKSDVSSVLSQMLIRNMVTRKQESSTLKGGKQNYYDTAPRMKKFELLSAPKKVTAVDVVEPPKSLLDTISVKQAHALYQELKVMFGAT